MQNAGLSDNTVLNADLSDNTVLNAGLSDNTVPISYISTIPDFSSICMYTKLIMVPL